MSELKINKPKKKGQVLLDFGFLKKIKSVKNIEFVIACVLGALILLIYFTNFTSSKTTNTNTNLNGEYTTSITYAAFLEEKLSQTLSFISGAGKVAVMITLDSGPELVIATSTDQKTNTSQNGDNKTESITVVENPVIITQNGTSRPLILMEILPKVKGVIVVAEGASNMKVKLDLLNAIQALLDISSNNIQIFVSN
ncbi:MAG: stage III sporulation protein AG [Clostridia bacterium]|nr:stage III sporulation protein AG [Clostridia bacterium]